MSTTLAAALLSELGDRELQHLAQMLRPFLVDEPAQPTRWLTAREAGSVLCLHEGTVTRLAREGRLGGAEKVGRSWRFDPARLGVSSPAVSPAGAVVAPRRRRARRSSSSSRVADAIRGD